MAASSEQQISLTDADVRAMTTQSHSSYVVGYNVTDKGHLSSISGHVREAMGGKTIEVLADKGYFSSEEIAACEEVGIAVRVPRPQTSGSDRHHRLPRCQPVLQEGEARLFRIGTPRPSTMAMTG